MKVILSRITPVVAILIFSISCDPTIPPEAKEGYLELNFSTPNNAGNQGGRLEEEDISKVLVSIADLSGNTVLSQHEVNVYSFNGGYITEPIALLEGDYSVTEFWVLNSDNEVVYATPILGSELDYLVDNPLPVSFSVAQDNTTDTALEVIPASLGSPSDFGYATFSFNIVGVISVEVAAFILDEATGFQLTTATLDILADGEAYLSKELPDSTEILHLNEEVNVYTFIASKEFYAADTVVYTATELKELTSPIKFNLLKNDTHQLVLQPSRAEGKDALLWSVEPDNNFGGSEQFYALSWTWHGIEGDYRSILEFDYSQIPAGAEILDATLTLYFKDSAYYTDLYYNFSTNASYLQQVTESWDESTVTWNNQPAVTTANNVFNPSNIDIPYQDIVADVTPIVQDQIINGNHGFLFRLETEGSYYRGVTCSSSDDVNPNQHPKLVITYK